MRLSAHRPRALLHLRPALLLGGLTACGNGPAATTEPQTTSVQTTSAQTQDAVAQAQRGFTLRRGVNITGQFQYGDYSPARLGELAQLRAMGADFARLPIEPTRFYNAASPDWKNLEAYLNEARRVGLKIILDLHPLYSTQRLALTGDARYPALLTALARKLPAWGVNNVALELMNEPIAPAGDECAPAFDWNAWQSKFYAAARAGSKDLTLILTGACWGGIDGLLKVTPVNDPKVIYSIHDYDEMWFTHQGAGWTDSLIGNSRNIPYPPTPAKLRAILPEVLYRQPTERLRGELQANLLRYGSSGFSKATMTERLGKAAAWAKINKARLLLGEYGVMKTVAPPQDRVQWVSDMRGAAEELGIAYAMWDYSPQGSFGPFRNGKLEAGVLRAQGFTPPADAAPTPPNPVSRSYPLNPVDEGVLPLADFQAGSQGLRGKPTDYYGYGKPDQPQYTPSPDGRAPWQGGHLQYDYAIPLNNDYGGVSAIVNVPTQATVGYTHLRLQLKATGGSRVQVQLANKAVDSGGDHPRVELPTREDWGWETYTVPLENFTQQGWGKPVDVASALSSIDQIIVTPLSTGTSGTISIDDIALVNIGDAGTPTDTAQVQYVEDFEGSPNRTEVFGYEEKPEAKTTFSSALVPGPTGKALEVGFNLDASQAWGGVAAATQLTRYGEATDLRALAAVRLDLAATGTDTLRVELSTEGVDTSGDNPQVRVTVRPGLNTYRLPISTFRQAGWGKPVDVAEVLRQARRVSVFADKVGTQGTFTIDNIVLEKK